MFTSLTTRNLTRLEDEAVCLATTLGTDIDAILRESSPEERIRILLTSIGTLPLSILFIQSERLRRDNCRWIPRTLLRRGAKVAEGSCYCQPDGRLMYQGRALISTRPFAINKTGSYFTIEVINGKQYFIGIQPQPGLDIEDGEKRYLIIPSRPALARDQVPQEVAILSLSPDQGVPSFHSELSEIETKYEFTAWLFDLALPGAKVLVAGGQAGQYQIWLPPKEHHWQLDAEAIDIIPWNLLTEESTILIGGYRFISSPDPDVWSREPRANEQSSTIYEGQKISMASPSVLFSSINIAMLAHHQSRPMLYSNPVEPYSDV
ncbi:het domain protein [Fusarium sp. NRRL 25303]|nr:het domain protein [Fusarium sp. NRRL 25303]